MRIHPVLIAVAAAAGCGAAPQGPVSDVPVVPSTLEAHRLTTLHCEHRLSIMTGNGPSFAALMAEGVGANLVVAFTYTKSTRTHNGTTRVVGTSLTAKAVHCPPEVHEQVLSLYREEGVR